MNKKANLSLVILSIIGLFAAGGLVIIQGGVTGAVSAQVFPVTSNIIIVNEEGKMQFKFDQASGTGDAKAHEGYFTIDDVQILEDKLGFEFDTWNNADVGRMFFETNDLPPIILDTPSFNDGLQAFKFDSNMNKGKIEFTFNQLQALEELQGNVIVECTPCGITVDGLTLTVTIPAPVQQFEFRIIEPIIPGPPASVVVQANPATLNCGEKSTITVTVKDAINQNVADHTQVILAANPPIGIFNPNPTETFSGIAETEYTAPSTPFVGIVRLTALSGAVDGFADVDVQCV